MIELAIRQKEGRVTRHQFNLDTVKIGRSKDNDLQISDVSVSRYHCEIRQEDGLYYIYDLQSLNGTRVGGQKIKRANITNNDKLKIGNVEVIFLEKKGAHKSPEESDHLLIERFQGLEIIQALNIQSFQATTRPEDHTEGIIDTMVDVVPGSATPVDAVEYKRELHRLRRAYRHLLFSYGLTASMATVDTREEFLARLVKSLFMAFDVVDRVFVTGFMQSTESFPILARKSVPGLELPNITPNQAILTTCLNDRTALYSVFTLSNSEGLSERIKMKDDRPMCTVMCAPMISQNEALGIIYVENFTKPYCFDDLDLELMCVISVLAATALKNIELYEQLARAYDDAYQKFHVQLSMSNTLTELGRVLTSIVSEDEILRRIIPMLREQIAINWCGIGLFRSTPKDTNCVFYHAMISSDDQTPVEIERATTHLPQAYLAQFIEAPRILSLDDMGRETSPLVPLVREMPPTAKYLIFTALVVQKQTIGFLAMSLSETSHVLDSQLSFINSVAFQTALACENAHLFNSLKEQQLQLRRLSNEIINAQEEERKRLARELHDDIGQIFSAMKLHVETMQNTPASGLPDKSVDALTHLAKRGMEDLRHISLNLRPPMLDDLGLLSTLNWYSKDYSSRYNVKVNINNDGVNDRKYDTEFETNLFRIIQEALTNVAKHAEAENVVIRLKEKETELDVAIRDDGKGFNTGDLDDSDGHLHGFGMLNMKERAAMFGGQLHVKSKPGAGTEIKMTFLLRNIRSTQDPNDSV